MTRTRGEIKLLNGLDSVDNKTDWESETINMLESLTEKRVLRALIIA